MPRTVLRPLLRASLLALVTLIAGAGCGSSSSSGGHADGGSGGTIDGAGQADARPADASLYDFGCGAGAPCTTDQVCCAMPGATLAFQCVAPGACPSADQITCDGPDECGGGTHVCCGVDVPDGTGSFPQCNPASLGTSCTAAAACPTHLGNSCDDTTKVVICHVAADCTDPDHDECCTFSSGGAALTFCTDSLTAQLGGATCHP